MDALRPRALLAVGSFGRGEACVRIDDTGAAHAESDLELLVLGSPSARRARRAVERALSEDLGLKVELIGENGYARELRGEPTLAALDLVHGSRVLDGEPPTLPAWRVEDVPPWEATRLLFNRLAEALPPAPEYALAKLAMAAGDARLLAAGDYVPSVRERQARLEGSVPEADVALLRWGYARKLGLAPPKDAPAADDIVGAGLRALREALARDLGLPRETSLPDALRAYEAADAALATRYRWSPRPSIERAHLAARALLRRRPSTLGLLGGPSAVHRVYAATAWLHLGEPGEARRIAGGAAAHPEGLRRLFSAVVG